eukprot:36822_1
MEMNLNYIELIHDQKLKDLISQFEKEPGINDFIQFVIHEEFDYDLVRDDANDNESDLVNEVPMSLFMNIKACVNNDSISQIHEVMHNNLGKLNIPSTTEIAILPNNQNQIINSFAELWKFIQYDRGANVFKKRVLDWEYDYGLIKDDINTIYSELKDEIPYNLFFKIQWLINDYDGYKNTKFKSLSYIQNIQIRLVACNGDCGSPISKFIDSCLKQKKIKNKREIIEEAFEWPGSPKRCSIITLMEENQIWKERTFYGEIYNKLKDKNCYIRGEKWVNKIVHFFELLSQNHLDTLEKIANASCYYQQRSLFEEIAAYDNRNTKSKINNNKKFRKKIKKVKKTKQYQMMEIKLDDFEIISIILYCDYNI